MKTTRKYSLRLINSELKSKDANFNVKLDLDTLRKLDSVNRQYLLSSES